VHAADALRAFVVRLLKISVALPEPVPDQCDTSYSRDHSGPWFSESDSILTNKQCIES
jgi:hypothetical protein